MHVQTATTAALALLLAAPLAAQRRVPEDLSDTRGFNYMAAEAANHGDHFRNYDPAVTDRDLDFAARLGLNQIRVFLNMGAWDADREQFRENLLHFMDAAEERGMGVMPVMQYGRGITTNREAWPEARPFVEDMVATIGTHPALAIWDVSNEPECCSQPPSENNLVRMDNAVYLAEMFHEIDPVTPVTIGATFAPNMITMGDAVDVLSFHNYGATRAEIREEIERAKSYAAEVGKPLINTEIGAPGRNNPYDIAIEEHMNAGVGWYIWELMVTGNWGVVQGVFYPDGSVRDPAVVAALLGVFRSRNPDNLLIIPDDEGRITRAVEMGREWLADPDASWERGLEVAETAAFLLESNQLTALVVPPTQRVGVLRAGRPNLGALGALIEDFTTDLEPWMLPDDD